MSFDEFLKETASLLGLHWRPFQRRGIKRKVERRIIDLGLSNFEQYLLRVKSDPGERPHLSQILTVTISRFFRDREVFDTLANSVLPIFLRNRETKGLKVWSIGCASGEEPYSFSLMWKNKFERDYPGVCLSILATDINEKMLRRAEEGRYKRSSLREVSPEVLQRAFRKEDGFFILQPSIKKNIELIRHDLLRDEPFYGIDIIFCRNLAFTYFSKEAQHRVLNKFFISLKEKGYLVIGKEETLPLIYPTLFVSVFPAQKIYQKFNLGLTLQ